MKDNSNSNKTILFLGLLFIAVGIVCNEWVLAALVANDGVIDNISDRIVIRFFDITLLITGLMLIIKRNSGKLKNFVQKLSLLFVSLLFCLLIFEIILRILTPSPIFHQNLPLWANQRMKIKTDLSGVSDVINHTTNKWGLRGDRIPEDWDERTSIITIGGSTTQCYYLSDDKTWPAQLQKLLRQIDSAVMVQNAGLVGHSTRGHLLMMKTVIPKVKPDIIILLVGINDLILSLNEDLLLFGRPGNQLSIKYYLVIHSRVLQFFNTWLQVLINQAFVINKTQFSYPVGHHFQKISERSPLPESLETILPSLEEFKSNVSAIIDIAKSEDIKPIFITQPMLFEDTEYWDTIGGRSYWMGRQKFSISAATYWKMLKMFNDNLLKICKSKNVTCFDLASKMPHSQKYFYDDVHYNNTGAELVAKKVFTFMKNKNVIRRK